MKESTTKSKDENTKITKTKDPGFCHSCGKLILSVMILFGVVAGSLYRTQSLPSYYFRDGIGDLATSSFDSNVNTILCSGVNVTSSQPTDFFLVAGDAKVNKDKFDNLTRRGDQLFPGSFHRDNEFYLLEGSRIKVNVCERRENSESRDDIEIVIIKGYDNWKSWKYGKCNSCPIVTKMVSSSYCDDGSGTELTYKVDNRGTYVVAVASRNYHDTTYVNVEAELEIHRTTFDLTHAQLVCLEKTYCVINVEYNSDFDVVMTFNYDQGFGSFTSDCQFRVMFWVGIFCIFPLSLILVLVIFGGMICLIDSLDKQKKTNKDIERNTFPPSYDTLVPNVSVQTE